MTKGALDIVGCIRGFIEATDNEEMQRLIKVQFEERIKTSVDKASALAEKKGLPAGWYYYGRRFIDPDDIFSFNKKEALEYIAFCKTGASEAKCNAFAYGFDPDRWEFTKGIAHGSGFSWTCDDRISGESFKSIKAAGASDKKRLTQGDDITLTPPPPEASSAVSIIQGQADGLVSSDANHFSFVQGNFRITLRTGLHAASGENELAIDMNGYSGTLTIDNIAEPSDTLTSTEVAKPSSTMVTAKKEDVKPSTTALTGTASNNAVDESFAAGANSSLTSTTSLLGPFTRVPNRLTQCKRKLQTKYDVQESTMSANLSGLDEDSSVDSFDEKYTPYSERRKFGGTLVGTSTTNMVDIVDLVSPAPLATVGSAKTKSVITKIDAPSRHCVLKLPKYQSKYLKYESSDDSSDDDSVANN